MQIRLATIVDIEGVRAVGQRCWPATYNAIAPPGYVDYGLSQWWSTEALQHAITAEQHWLWVAEEAGEIIGTAHFVLLNPQEAIMWKFYVLPAWQGQGVGRQLFEQGRAVLPPEVHTIFTDYLSTNQRAAAVYVSLGFAFVRAVDETVQGHPLTYTSVKRAR